MNWNRWFFISLFICISLDRSYAQTYLINPHDEKVSSLSGLPLNKHDESLWLSSFYKHLHLTKSGDRTEIKDENGESLDKKMKRASQAYLQMQYSEAAEIMNEALQLLANSMPYSKLFDDLIEVAALKLMIAEAELQPEVPNETKVFAHDPALAARLPVKSQSRMQSLESKRLPLTSKDLPAPADRILISGKEVKLPASMEPGRALVHLLSKDEIQAYWLDVQSTGNHFEKIWMRSIWKNLPHKNLKEALEVSRPKHLSRSSGITVIIHDSSNQPTPLMISQARLGGTTILKSDEVNEADWSKNFNQEFDSQVQETRGSSILSSPWFWGSVAILAGVGGYFIIQSNHSSTVTTP